MHDELFDEMRRLETRHWWYCARRRIVLAMLERSLPAGRAPSAVKVCDIGCGCGIILQDLAERGYQVAGMDASERAVQYCTGRDLPVVQGILPDDAARLPGPFDVVMMLDVLEHIPDDRAALVAVAKAVVPGGALILTVPAFPWLWSRHDDRFSHLRRYTKATFKTLLAAVPQARVERLSYMNTVLFPAAVASRLAARIHDPHDNSVELKVPPAPLNRLLEVSFAAERTWLARGVRLPFGLSLIAVLRLDAGRGEGE